MTDKEKLKTKWKQLNNGTAILGIAIAFVVLIAVCIIFPPLEWTPFIFCAPLIMNAIGNKWIIPDYNSEIPIFFATITLSFLLFYLTTKSIDILYILFMLIAENSFVFCMYALCIALLSPLLRLAERWKIRRAPLKYKDVKHWFKNSFITNISGWFAMSSVVFFTLRHKGIENVAPLKADFANPVLGLIAQIILYIVINFALQQQKHQAKVKSDFEVSKKWDDDIEKNFSFSSIAQITNLLWLFLVGFSVVLNLAYIWNYAAAPNADVRWLDLLLSAAMALPFFASCAFQPEHPFVFISTYVVGTAVLLAGLIFYIVISPGISLVWIALPISVLVIHAVIAPIIKIKRINYSDKPTLFCIAYICAAITSPLVMVMAK